MIINNCKLCGKHTNLLESHIVPKFVYNYLKKTSITPFLRNGSNPNIRKQDGYKTYLLCENCELMFSKYERQFALKHFQPAVVNSLSEIEYENEMFYFVSSILWRFIAVNIDRYRETLVYNKLLACETELRNFLVHNVPPNQYKNYYLLKTDYVTIVPKGIKNINQYFTRTIDSQIIYDDTYCLFFLQIPFFIFIVDIYGLNENDFPNSSINIENGKFTFSSMMCKSPEVSGFMQHQMMNISQLSISKAQQETIEKEIKKNIHKLKDSKFFEAYVLDSLLDK